MIATFCEPAEARIVEIRLKETSPLNGQTCTTVDRMVGFYAMSTEQILLVGSVIPANCTIQRLINYSCRERLGFCRGGTGRRGTGRRGTGTGTAARAARITIQVLILCNACNIVNSPSSVPTEGRIDSDNFINRQELAVTFGVIGATFSVEAFETRDSKRGIMDKTRRGFRTKRRTRTQKGQNYYNFFCGDRLLSIGETMVECGKHNL